MYDPPQHELPEAVRQAAKSENRPGEMRPLALLRSAFIVLLLLGSSGFAQLAGDASAVAAFAERAGLRDVTGFVETVQSLRDSGRLPPRYATKDEARAQGWRGGGLCAVWPGHVIGGDRFNNFGRQLPGAPGRVYREADLDADCRGRGPKRLIFSNDGLIFVTVDHYSTFMQVP
ncbi:MAG TPA: ribonuclease domain-containing protein [Stellaceae bacterium]